MSDNTSSAPTNINTIVTITSIIYAIVTGTLVSPRWSILVVLIGVVLLIVFYVVLQYSKHCKQSKKYIKSCLDNDYFRNYWIDRRKAPYVGIDCSQTGDCSDRKSLKDFFIKDFFQCEHKRDTKYAVILGMTGSGKTMAMVDLFMEHVMHSTDDSYKIRIFSMRNEKLWEDISSSIAETERGNYILLLDALDENKEAQNYLTNNQIKNYMDVLKEKTQGFARVVVSCRTQFFKCMEDEPGETENAWVKRYLAPFSPDQVNDYLKKKFGVPSNNQECEKARRIVFSCREDFCRPLILSWIDVIVGKDEIPPKKNLSLYDIYTYIIDAWLDREAFNRKDNMVNTEKREKLKRHSLDLADYLYKNGLTEISEHNVTDDLFLRRSLLSRSGNGYQFSHKSFYEYFLAKIFFENPEKIQSLQGLDFAMKIFDELVTNFQKEEKHNEDEKSRVATALNKVGIEYCRLHQYKYAEDKLQLALDIRKELAQQGSDESILFKYKLLLTRTLSDMANLYNDTHHYTNAEEKYTDSLAIFRDLDQNSLAEFYPYYAGTLNNLAILHYHTYKYEDSKKEYRKALAITHQLKKNNSNEFQYLLSIILNNLANLHRDTFRYNYARRGYRKALTIRHKLVRQNRDAFLPNVAQTLNDLAILHRVTFRFQDAEREYTKALSILKELAISKPDVFQPYIAIVMNNLGNLHREQQNYEEAKIEYNEALRIRRELAKRNPDAYSPYKARTLNNLATLHRHTKDYEDAKKEYKEALSTTPDDRDAAITWNNIAALRQDLQDYEQAKNAYENALNYYRKLAEQCPNPFRSFLGRTLHNMAILYQDSGDTVKATEMEQESKNMYKDTKTINSDAFYEDIDDVIQLFNPKISRQI